MFSAIRRIFAPDSYHKQAHALYMSVVTQSRQERFYKEYAVPDTLDGRFDMVVLHLFLLKKRLGKENPELMRAVEEVFFADMDRSLREMGVTDTGVGKRIKQMAQAYYGRVQAYNEAGGDVDLLAQAIGRNIFRSETIVDGARQLASHMLAVRA